MAENFVLIIQLPLIKASSPSRNHPKAL